MSLNIFGKIFIIILSIVIVIVSSSVQMFAFLNVEEVKPTNFVVPSLLGLAFGWLFLKLLNFSWELRKKESEIKKLNEELKKEVDEKTQQLENIEIITSQIFNNQKNMTLLTTGNDIRLVNKAFFRYFPKYKTLDDFKKEHSCICDFFEEEEGYLKPRYNGQTWVEYVDQHPEELHKAILKVDDKKYVMEINVSKFYLGNEKLYVATLNDITRIEELNKMLEYRLYNDELTGLPNRRKLIEDIKQNLHEGICLINIDNFSSINDTYGIETGDKLLKEVSTRLNVCINRTGGHKAYKLHADEFAVLHFKDSVLTEKEFEELANELISELIDKPYVFGEYEVFINVSVGIALIYSVQSFEELLPSADIALKTAKKQRKHFVFYDASLQTKKDYEENILWTKNLIKAMLEDRITVYFQPIYSLKDKMITKYECLMRMVDENGNVVPPIKFLKIAKITKLYHSLTKIVVEKSFKKFANLDYEFSINIDVEDIINHNIREFIKEKIIEYGVGNRLTFEIVETESVENYDVIKDFVKEFREFGCKFAIDDFGTGYSNIERLVEIKFDCIKIDASVIKKLPYDKESELIVTLVNNLAHGINAKTVAEYVESGEILEKVEQLGIDFAQGFYIGKPMPDIIEKEIMV